MFKIFITTFIVFIVIIIIFLILISFMNNNIINSKIKTIEKFENINNGLKFAVYSGYFNDDINWFNNKSPITNGTGITIDISNLENGTNNIKTSNDIYDIFSVLWTGYFYANITGNWYFKTSSDDASYLYINNTLIVNNGGLHGRQDSGNNVYLIENTYYPIKIMFGENYGGNNMTVTFISPNGISRTNGLGYYFTSKPEIISYEDTNISGAGNSINIIDKDDKYVTFINDGTFTISRNIYAQIFMIGGGGGGGFKHGGGGGAGAYYFDYKNLKAGKYSISIGIGGNRSINDNSVGTNGGDTSISLSGNNILLVKGGGFGGSYPNLNANSGGCGGGGLGWDNDSTANIRYYQGGTTNNSGTNGTGFAGGKSYVINTNNSITGSTFYAISGGGGGAGGAGGDASIHGKTQRGGNGGDGVLIDIKGFKEAYGGGGAGYYWCSLYSETEQYKFGGYGGSIGGITIGGYSDINGNNIEPIANTGSGGAGGKGYSNNLGTNGSAGIVILRYKSNLNDYSELTNDETKKNNNDKNYQDNISNEYINQNINDINDIIVSSQIDSNNTPKNLFNLLLDNTNTSFQRNLFNTNGDYIGNSSIYDIKCEYIIINFKNKFILKKYLFIANNINNKLNAPKSWKIYGIDDNNSPQFICEENNVEIRNYETNNNTLQFFTLYNVKEYKKYVILFTKIIGDQTLNFNQIKFYSGLNIIDLKSTNADNIRQQQT